MDIVIVLLLLCILAVQSYMFYKLRRTDRFVWQMQERLPREMHNTFRQIEALQSLATDLKLERSLPPTRNWAGSPDFLREIVDHALAQQPEHIVECSSGTSTVVLARACQINGRGHVYSLEHEAAFAEATRAHLKRHGLSQWATVIDAPLVVCQSGADTQPWYDTRALPDMAIDMLVIDGPPESTAPLARYPAGPALFPRLSSQASVFLDDAMRPSERQAVARWLQSFPKFSVSHKECEKGLAVLKAPASPTPA